MDVKLGELTKIKTGKLDANSATENGEYPFFTCSREPLKISTYSYDCECVLVAGNGDLNVKYYNGKFDAYQRTYIIESNGDGRLYLPYLYYYMTRYVQELRELSIGGVIKYIKLGNLTDAKINLPSLEDQKKACQKLENIETIIKNRKSQLEQLHILAQSAFSERFGDAVSNPMNWTVKKLGELSLQINSGNTPKGGSEVYVDKGILFFRSQNVWNNRLEMDDIAYIDEATHKKMARSSLKHGDILITKTGRINTENSSLGRSAIYTGEDDKANVNGHVYFVRLKPGYNNRFILQILTSREFRKLIRTVCVGGIDKRQLNKEHIESFPIICPPNQLINDYIELLDQIEKTKLLIQQSLDKSQLLFDSLMQEYFG